MVDGTTVLARTDQATFQVVAGEAILIHLQTGSYYSLNQVGTEFWTALDGRLSVADHAAPLAEAHEVDVATVLADLIELAEDLIGQDLATCVVR